MTIHKFVQAILQHVDEFNSDPEEWDIDTNKVEIKFVDEFGNLYTWEYVTQENEDFMEVVLVRE